VGFFEKTRLKSGWFFWVSFFLQQP